MILPVLQGIVIQMMDRPAIKIMVLDAILQIANIYAQQVIKLISSLFLIASQMTVLLAIKIKEKYAILQVV